MLEFTPLASSSHGNAYIVDDGQTRLLLEAGLQAKRFRERAGFIMHKIDACFVSHEHQDHACGLRGIMQAGIDVYCSQGTIEALGLSGHRLHPVAPGQQVQIGTMLVVPFSVIHDAAEPLGFLVATRAGDKLLFATDTHYIPHRFNGLTHIAIEANFEASVLKENVAQGYVPAEVGKRLWDRHMSLQQVKKFLAANDLSKVQEIHLLHLSDQNSDAGRFQSEIERITGKPVYVANQ
jgi:phosphoribosyl 1,2-cyclic phosphodiesterase